MKHGNNTLCGVQPKVNKMENIYKRVGAVLEDSTIVNSVLAYDNDDEVVLMGAGFTRTGSVEIDGEIVDVYTLSKKRKVIVIDETWTHTDSDNLRKIRMSSTIDKPYLKNWNTKY